METSEKINLKDTIPFLGKHVRAFQRDEGSPLLCLEVPRTSWVWLYGVLERMKRSSCRLDLDAIGSRAISRVGSGWTVEEILLDLQTAFPEEQQLEERLYAFFFQLHKKGVLVLTRKA